MTNAHKTVTRKKAVTAHNRLEQFQTSPGGNHSIDSGNSSGKNTGLDTSSDSDPHNTNNNQQGNQEQFNVTQFKLKKEDKPKLFRQTPLLVTPRKISSISHQASTPSYLSSNNSNLKESRQISIRSRPSREQLDLINRLKFSWYRPDFSRDQAISLLKTAPVGTFLIRDSTSYKFGYGLALRVERLPEKIAQSLSSDSDLLAEHVRHYLIETVDLAGGMVGYLLKGSSEEKIFPSLERLVLKHIVQNVSLPVKLRFYTQLVLSVRVALTYIHVKYSVCRTLFEKPLLP